MSVKLTAPMFFDNLSGSVKNVGTLRTRNGKTTITSKRYNSLGNKNANIALLNCFAIAKKQHSALAKTFTCEFGVCKLRIKPVWQEYWNQYLIENPECLL